MRYKLWIDDDAKKEGIEDWRKPPIDDPSFIIATSSSEAIEIIEQNGFPSFIDFDHDLGMKNGIEDTAKIVCKYLFENYPDSILSMRYNVHSQNPEGKKWIVSYMETWKKVQGSKNEIE